MTSTPAAAPLVAVTGFRLGFTNTSRFPYASARLACGHFASVVLVPRRGQCATCGVEQELTPSEGKSYHVCCGTSHFRALGTLPNPHVEADRVTKVGDLVACEQCVREDEAEAEVRAFDRSTISHVRFRPFGDSGYHTFYRRDPSSPSGVLACGSCPATPRFTALLRELGYSALSPTEGLYRSGAILS